MRRVSKPTQKIDGLANACLLFSIFFTIGISIPLIATDNKLLSGNSPPQVKAIQAEGRFTYEYDNKGAKCCHYIDFITTEGHEYIIPQGVYPRELLKLAQAKPSEVFYAEGFILQNGQGSYFPALITDQNGKTILSREVLIAARERMMNGPRNSTIHLLYVSAIFFVLFIFFFSRIFNDESRRL